MKKTTMSLLAVAIALAFASAAGANEKSGATKQESSWSQDEKSKQLNDPYTEADFSAKGVSEQSASTGTGLDESPHKDRSQASNEGGMNRGVKAGSHKSFTDLDRNHDGTLSRAELDGDRGATDSWATIDTDRNSSLSRSEWDTYVMDADGDTD
jgi:hypothetical protein